MDRYRTAKELLAKVPGVLEAALYLRHRLLPPSRSEFSWNSFPGWMEDLKRLRPKRIRESRAKVLLFGMNDNMISMILAIATILLSRDCDVDFAFLPFTNYAEEDPLSVVKSNRFHYWSCVRGRNVPGLRFIDVSSLPMMPPSVEMEGQANTQGLIDVKWWLLREELDLQGAPEVRKLLEFRTRRNLDCMRGFSGLLASAEYDAIITLNGNIMEFGALYRVGRILGKPVTSFEFAERLETIVFSSDRPAVWVDTSRLWAEDFPHILSTSARNNIEELIFIRKGTNWGGFANVYQSAKYDGARKDTLARLKMRDDGSPIVLVCPNIAWDSAWLGLDRAFPSMLSWLRQTAAYFARRPECQVIVRAHPAEHYAGTAEPVLEVIRASLGELPAHFRLVEAEESLNTYDLMDICDVGLVYNSTTGLEMALRGIPVVVTALPHYGRKGFTTDVDTPEQYFYALEYLLADPKSGKLSDRQRELAWCYADIYFFRWPQPFPWSITNFWADLGKWPVSRVLSDEGRTTFGPTFDLLVGRNERPDG